MIGFDKVCENSFFWMEGFLKVAMGTNGGFKKENVIDCAILAWIQDISYKILYQKSIRDFSYIQYNGS